MLFLLAGRAVRSRSRLTAELHEAAVRATEEREAEAERAVADERRRIAREMHDVVAHSVSMMVVQAGGARRILERDPARAVAAAELIERTGREALRRDARAARRAARRTSTPSYAPQPTLRDLDALVERARSAGVPVARRRSRASAASCPPGSTSPPTASSRRRSRTSSSTAAARATEVRCDYRADAVEVRDRRSRRRQR